jgi:hypothetical protein
VETKDIGEFFGIPYEFLVSIRGWKISEQLSEYYLLNKESVYGHYYHLEMVGPIITN